MCRMIVLNVTGHHAAGGSNALMVAPDYCLASGSRYPTTGNKLREINGPGPGFRLKTSEHKAKG